MTATIPRVPRQRGFLDEQTIERLQRLRDMAEAAQTAYRMQTVLALDEGSFSEVSKATGLSTNTLQRWKREAGA